MCIRGACVPGGAAGMWSVCPVELHMCSLCVCVDHAHQKRFSEAQQSHKNTFQTGAQLPVYELEEP